MLPAAGLSPAATVGAAEAASRAEGRRSPAGGHGCWGCTRRPRGRDRCSSSRTGAPGWRAASPLAGRPRPPCGTAAASSDGIELMASAEPGPALACASVRAGPGTGSNRPTALRLAERGARAQRTVRQCGETDLEVLGQAGHAGVAVLDGVEDALDLGGELLGRVALLGDGVREHLRVSGTRRRGRGGVRRVGEGAAGGAGHVPSSWRAPASSMRIAFGGTGVLALCRGPSLGELHHVR